MDRQKIERISRALSDETRLRIFEAISSCDHMTCGQIVSLRGVTPATVSHHLRILEDAGLIDCRREGQFVYSTANPKAVEEYTATLYFGEHKEENEKGVKLLAGFIQSITPLALRRAPAPRACPTPTFCADAGRRSVTALLFLQRVPSGYSSK